MLLAAALIATAAALAFCVAQFADLMRRPDGDFPGRYDKPIWAAAILLANVLGAAAYYACKPPAAPRSGAPLRADLAAARAARDAGGATRDAGGAAATA